MDADGGGWAYVMVADSKCSVCSVKDRSSAESRDPEQMLGLKQRESISGGMEKRFGWYSILWLFCSRKCPLWLVDRS